MAGHKPAEIIEEGLVTHERMTNHRDGLVHCRCHWKSRTPSHDERNTAHERLRVRPNTLGEYISDHVLLPGEAFAEHRGHQAEAIAEALRREERAERIAQVLVAMSDRDEDSVWAAARRIEALNRLDHA